MLTLFQEAENVDTEIHLSTGVILSLFFGATLVSAVFFGMGYSFGVSHGVGADTLSLRGLLHARAQSVPASTQALTNTTSSLAMQVPSAAPVQMPSPAVPTSMQTAAASTSASASVASEPISSTVLGDAALPAAAHAAAITYSVQIAASASRHDAQFLIAKLHRAGLHARLHHAVQDRFFRVQIGQFASRSDAMAMREKVLAAGYKAIVKSNN